MSSERMRKAPSSYPILFRTASDSALLRRSKDAPAAGNPSPSYLGPQELLAQTPGYNFSHVPDIVKAPAAPGKSKAENKIWLRTHDKLVSEVAKARKGQGLELIFYGDSIFEAWMATEMGEETDRFKDVPAVYTRNYGRLRGGVFAISGDTSQNLLWRLKNGEAPEGLAPQAVVILIGTNDLSKSFGNKLDKPETANTVAQGIVDAATTVLASDRETQVVVLAVLPRGDKAVEAPSLRYILPNKWSGAIESVNAKVQNWAQWQKRATYLDCGAEFIESDDKLEGGKRLKKDLMPDALHPNGVGMQALADCIHDSLQLAIPNLPVTKSA
ncbi:hypothetical protein WJX84_008063 [Apatococcus fuscideae]|uniref:SGNH hydrolase-type esterase domain-containing protein n=1 Tax=Apatococcus fuscideae TaxID=2026836 RepID=A0AAW1SV97_9CHLO